MEVKLGLMQTAATVKLPISASFNCTDGIWGACLCCSHANDATLVLCTLISSGHDQGSLDHPAD